MQPRPRKKSATGSFRRRRPSGLLVPVRRGLTPISPSEAAALSKLHAIRPVRGRDGDPGQDGAPGIGVSAIEETDDGKALFRLDDGRELALGNLRPKDGEDGDDGRDGTGIANLSRDGTDLVADLTDGRSLNLGNIVGPKGEDGIGIEDISETAAGSLRIRLSSGEVFTLGRIRAKDGDPGRPGRDGVSIQDAEIDDDGHLVMVFSDGRRQRLNRVVGKDGDHGRDGETKVLRETVKPARPYDFVDWTPDGWIRFRNEDGTWGRWLPWMPPGGGGGRGPRGRGVASTQIVDGDLIVTYTDGSTENAGSIGGQQNVFIQPDDPGTFAHPVLWLKTTEEAGEITDLSVIIRKASP